VSDASRQFSEEDLQRLRAHPFVGSLQYLASTESTNTTALRQAAAFDGPLPLLVLTERQTGGRGRGSNVWWADRGALTFSLLIDASHSQLPQRQWPAASLLTGLAVAEACDAFLPPGWAGVKWPNDVLVQGRKLSGVLVESPSDAGQRLVLGMGVNVNNAADRAPAELRPRVVSLCELLGREAALADVLAAILDRLAHWLGLLGEGMADLVPPFADRCVLTARELVVVQPARRIQGRCLGIGPDGALEVATPTGVERCFSGVVTVLD
jgi:BirA family biotin operon repressor/biotin-[acetyl-CoA-carboxylase] ligase